jgi:gas vesicle protein
MTLHDETHGGSGFWIGIVTGGIIGAGLAMVFAPRVASEFGQRVRTSVSDLGDAVSIGYHQVTTRVAGAVDDVTARGQTVRDDVADAVGRAAREVEQIAMAAKTGSGPRRS